MLKISRLIFLIQILFIEGGISKLLENDKTNIDIPSSTVNYDERNLLVMEGDFDAISSGNPYLTYNDMKVVCENKGERLCLSSEICDMSTRQVTSPELSSFSSDNWIAVGDSQDEWLTLYHSGDRYCKTHTEVAGEKPGWSNIPNNGPHNGGFIRLVKCCFLQTTMIRALFYTPAGNT